MKNYQFFILTSLSCIIVAQNATDKTALLMFILVAAITALCAVVDYIKNE